MKGIFGLVGLLLSLVIVGVLVTKQLTPNQQIVPVQQAPTAAGPQSAASAPATTVREQSQQVQQQYKQAIEEALQQPRSVPDEN